VTFKDFQKVVQSQSNGSDNIRNLHNIQDKPSGYSTSRKTNRNTFVLEDNAAFGMVLDVLRKMGEICLSYRIKRFYMMHFRNTSTSGY
jgi:hypothetical protein